MNKMVYINELYIFSIIIPYIYLLIKSKILKCNKWITYLLLKCKMIKDFKKNKIRLIVNILRVKQKLKRNIKD